MVAILIVARAYPIGHAIGGEGVTVPVEQPFGRRASQGYKLAVLVFPEATEAPAPWRNLAFVGTKNALYTGRVLGRSRWEAKTEPGLSMGLKD
jgi:hypothetical protein